MSSQSVFLEIRARFIQFMEGLAEQRGFKSIHGRILACFMMNQTPLTQEEMSSWTGYSISSISRALDQLTSLGSVRRYKQSGIRSYFYELSIPLGSILTGALAQWIALAQKSMGPIDSMTSTLSNLRMDELDGKQAKEAKQLRIRLSELSISLTKAIPLLEKLMTELSEVNSSD